MVFSVGRRGYLFSSPALSMRLLVFSGGRRGYLFLKFTSFDEALGLLSWEEGLGSWSSQLGGGEITSRASAMSFRGLIRWASR